MKKLISSILALVCVLGLVGCAHQVYQLPHDQFCYSADHSRVVEIPTDGRQYIIDLLNKAVWINDVSNCAGEYIFYTQKQELHYHSECGTFNDITNKRSTTLTPQQRTEVNRILGATDAVDSVSQYRVTLANDYPILNKLDATYTAGKEVTVKLSTITEHYYILYVNGIEQSMDMEASDLMYTYFTFTMPCEDVVIEIRDKWVDIPVSP